MASAGMARRLSRKFSRMARAWARGVGAAAGGSWTRSEPITAAASSALPAYRRRRVGTVVPAAAATDSSDMRA
jgi:hypothetical protein